MPDKMQTLGMMGEMLGGEQLPFGAATGGEPVRCRVCRLDIDATTGEPLQEVTQDNVEAVRRYMMDSGQSELGGQQLELSTDMSQVL